MTEPRQIASGGSAGISAVTLALLAVAVFATVVGCVMLTFFTGRIAAVWVANAIVVVFLMKHPVRDWPRILMVAAVANFAADLTCGDTVPTAAIFTLCNIAEVLLVALPLRRLGLDSDIARPKALIAFYALSFGPATLISSAIAGLHFHWNSGAAFLSAAGEWYAADALGLGILVPPLVAARYGALKAMFAREQRDGTLALVGALIAAVIFCLTFRQFPLGFIFLPVVILFTFKRGFEGGAVGLSVSGIYLIGTLVFLNGPPVLIGHPLRDRILIMQLFVTIMGLTVMMVGAALEERRRLERGLATAIERAELAREEAMVARQAAEEASRAKSMFLANMSHELRTPLNAVIGFSQTMQEETFGPLGHAKYKEYAGLISGAGAHLLDLISDILDMSRIEAGKLELNREKVEVSPLVRECVRLIEDTATRAGLKIAIDVPANGMTLLADPRAVKQILLNLLSNAVKFTPAGGRIEIAATRDQANIILSVRDSGIGIPADQIPRAGNPFVQFHRKSAKQGTGLGLALVRTLAQLHGGEMHIASASGKGTTVTITLPADKTARAAA